MPQLVIQVRENDISTACIQSDGMYIRESADNRHLGSKRTVDQTTRPRDR